MMEENKPEKKVFKLSDLTSDALRLISETASSSGRSSKDEVKDRIESKKDINSISSFEEKVHKTDLVRYENGLLVLNSDEIEKLKPLAIKAQQAFIELNFKSREKLLKEFKKQGYDLTFDEYGNLKDREGRVYSPVHDYELIQKQADNFIKLYKIRTKNFKGTIECPASVPESGEGSVSEPMVLPDKLFFQPENTEYTLDIENYVLNNGISQAAVFETSSLNEKGVPEFVLIENGIKLIRDKNNVAFKEVYYKKKSENVLRIGYLFMLEKPKNEKGEGGVSIFIIANALRSALIFYNEFPKDQENINEIILLPRKGKKD